MFSNIFTLELILLTLAWAVYLALHSVLASDGVKAWVQRHWPAVAARYRLLYNGIAIGLLIPLLAVSLRTAGEPLWQWQGRWAWVSPVASLLAALGFVWSSRAYDLKTFLGLARPAVPTARFGLTAVHRWVRHPWYFFGLLWLWTRDMDSIRLAVVLTITVYIGIGAWLEDNKLEREWGADYQRYRQQVPGLLPRPWRFLSHDDYRRWRA